MKTDEQARLTPAQSVALQRLRTPPEGAEVKEVHVYQPEPEEVGDPRLSRMLLVQVEFGFYGDEADFRRALRERKTYLVSPRGRVEPWTFNGKGA